MMDIEKLIERLYKHHTDWGEGRTQDFFEVCLDCKDAATALSTLQAENEKLKDQLYDGEGVNLVNYWMQQAKIEENGHRNCQAENEKLRAELEQVRQERDAAVGDMEALMWYSGEGCQICANAVEVHKRPYVRLDCKLGAGIDCKPKWRGQKEE